MNMNRQSMFLRGTTSASRGTATRIDKLEARCLLSAAGWSDVINNPYMPLIPGTTYVYKGILDGAVEKNVTFVTGNTKVIMGVTTTVVLDRVFADGELIEKTYD